MYMCELKLLLAIALRTWDVVSHASRQKSENLSHQTGTGILHIFTARENSSTHFWIGCYAQKDFFVKHMLNFILHIVYHTAFYNYSSCWDYSGCIWLFHRLFAQLLSQRQLSRKYNYDQKSRTWLFYFLTNIAYY
jgi:hypothetical protein